MPRCDIRSQVKSRQAARRAREQMRLRHCLRGLLHTAAILTSHAGQSVPAAPPRVTVVLIACGEKFVRAVKATADSALDWSTPGSVEVVVVHDALARDAVRSQLPQARRIEVPADEGRFKCFRLKLTLPQLPLDGLVLVLDADTLVVADLAELASWFAARSKGAVWAALAPESARSYAANWYRCCSSVDYYRPSGLNAGVLLFNVTAWRRISPALLQYLPPNASLPDQDAFNSYFQQHRHEVVELPFEWNWRSRYVSGLDPDAAKIVHAAGTRCAAHNDCHKAMLFQALGRQRPSKHRATPVVARERRHGQRSGV